MRKFWLATAAVLVLVSPASALDSRLKAGLLKLDPDTRLEQRCDVAVLDQIAQENKDYKPDRVVAYAMQAPTMVGDEIKTRGAAFRSKGEWYRLAFKCQTAPDRMEVLALHYKIGEKIPEDEWTTYNLYN